MFSMRGPATALFVATLFVPVAPASGTQTGSCERDSEWATVLVPEVREVVQLTNEHRAGIGLGPLAQSRSLTRAALWKAAHMAGYDYFDHDDPAPPVERTWDERVTDCGYPHGAGENIAVGYGTPESVMQGWLNSNGHRRNIEGSYSAIGVGAAVADGSIYWVQVFGTQDDSGGDAHSAPVAAADQIAGREDRAEVVDLVPNDADPDGDPLGVASVTQPSNGRVTLTPDGGVRYSPDGDFHGEDRFSYQVVDVFGYTGTGEVMVRVESVNDLPHAVDDFARVRAGRSIVIDVVANDADVETPGDLAVTGIVSGPTRGAANVGPDARSITYRARRGTGGKTDRIVYEVSDGEGGLARAGVSITIRRARP